MAAKAFSQAWRAVWSIRTAPDSSICAGITEEDERYTTGSSNEPPVVLFLSGVRSASDLGFWPVRSFDPSITEVFPWLALAGNKSPR